METEPLTPEPSPSPPASAPAADPQQVLQTMLDGLGLQTQVERHMMDDTLLLHVATAEPGRLIGKHGQTLNHLQFLLNRVLQRLDANAPHVIVDCERYRERQRDDLIKIALDAVDRIGPFSAFDRRIIHVHMQRDPELEAISEGEEDGGRKKMLIRVKPKPAN